MQLGLRGTRETQQAFSSGTHPDYQGEGHGAGDTFGHCEVARICVDDKCVIRISWENSG